MANEWSPIDTAPKDGSKIDLWVIFPDDEVGERYADASWNAEAGEWQLGQFHAGQYVHSPRVTHWMHVEPPQSERGR